MKIKTLRIVSFVSFCLTAHFGFGQDRYTVSDEDASTPGSPRVVVLRDTTAGVEAAVAPSEGGELSSYRVQFKGQWVELLYHARDYSPGPGFKGKGPLLWPAVGAQYPVGTIPKTSCGDGTYTVGGKVYPMPCHGFARTLPWTEISRSADKRGASVTVELRDSDRTRQYYPFAFRVDATYQVTGGHLTIDYTVTSDSSNTEPMPFSIGNHIAFKTPFLDGTDPAKMTFETHSTVQLLRNAQGVLSGDEQPRSFGTPERLGDFDAHVALPLTGYRSQPFAQLVDPQGMTLRLTQQASSVLPEPLIRFNAYGGPKAGYFCPEPWFGVQNSLNTGKGLVKLNPGGSWRWRLEIQVQGPPPSDPVVRSGVERFGGNFAFVEGPVWVKDGYLVFSDIYNSRIMRSAGTNHFEVYRDSTNAANGNSMDVEGRLYSCERDGHRVVRMEKDGQLTVIASEFEGKRLNSPNDVVVRRDGQVYFSDPASDAVLEPKELGFNGVYHVTPQGKISLVAKMTRPNGVALTPDGRTLYVADSQERKILAYDLDAEGKTSRERVFISGIDGGPDGLRVAANGNLYIACRGIAVYTPDGKFVKMIEFPETPANCAFGDSDLRTLYVTARTSVYRVRVPDKGFLQY
ncbi:MAG TPA: SMP-30/gluconolactonase/LRE family protein [Acidobacteriaceae bacterium]